MIERKKHDRNKAFKREDDMDERRPTAPWMVII